jgi:hypothetical protein
LKDKRRKVLGEEAGTTSQQKYLYVQSKPPAVFGSVGPMKRIP